MAKKQSYDHWRIEHDNNKIAWLYFDKQDAAANVLSEAVFSELNQILDQLEKQPPAGLVILSAKQSGFIAGADVREFTKIESTADALQLISRGQQTFDRIENLNCRSVALIDGFCLGGGLELALACSYRVVSTHKATRLGLPEVLLGIHPGFGGSMRLVRTIGAAAAMDMILSGRTVDGYKAAKLGLADRVVPERHLKTAAEQMLVKRPELHRPTRWQELPNHPLIRPSVAWYLRKQVAKRARPEHYPAPYAMIDVWQDHGDEERGMLNAEAESVARLAASSTARNLIRVFFLQERLKGMGRDSALKFRHVHVVGAGVMGGDIAAWCALQGMHVTLQDRAPEFIAPALKRAKKLFESKIRDRRERMLTMDRLLPDHQGNGVAQADLVIEAIIENVDAKQSLFRDMEARLKPGAIMATNTSSIPLEVIGEALQAPERLVGIHFFNPVAKMQLVEIIRASNTSEQTVNDAAAFARQINRLPIPVTSSLGFLVNRILLPYLMEAVHMVAEGICPVSIDLAAEEFGMPMGPVELADRVGLDVCLSVGNILAGSLGETVPEELKLLVGRGHLGLKSGQGFYTYEKGKAKKKQEPGGSYKPADMMNRMVMRMLNESVACLREGVVEDADLLDAGMIFGTGFAPFRGGPMNYIQQLGVEECLDRLNKLEQKYGDRFVIDAGWSTL